MRVRILLLCVMAGQALWPPALAAVIHVPGDYASIAEGLAAVQYGDTVLVGPGTYEEHSLLLPSGVTLLSLEGPEATVIDALGLGRVVTVEEWADDATRIEGFTITRGHASAGGGVYCCNAPAVVVGNVFIGNTATSYGGAVGCDECSAVIEGNVISGNWANYGAGISVWGVEYSPEIRGNEILLNEADEWGGGIDSWQCSPLIEANTIAWNESHSYGAGISCSEGASLITGNTIAYNVALAHGSEGGGIYCGFESAATIEFNIIRNNSASGGGGIKTSSADLVIVRNNTFDANYGSYGANIGIHGAILLDRNIIRTTANYGVLHECCEVTVLCCDFCGSAVPWLPEEGNPVGTNGNFSEDPLFCDLNNNDYTLDCKSPCVNGYGCGLIGALGVGCSASRVEPVTWSGIKAMYR